MHTSSTQLITCRAAEANEQRELDDQLRTVLRNTRKLVLRLKKNAVVSESSDSDSSVAIVSSTLMQAMTLERSVVLVV